MMDEMIHFLTLFNAQAFICGLNSSVSDSHNMVSHWGLVHMHFGCKYNIEVAHQSSVNQNILILENNVEKTSVSTKLAAFLPLNMTKPMELHEVIM